MKTLVGTLSLMVAIFLSFPIQEWIPPVLSFYGARVLLVPALFAYGALALPFPVMLGLAAYCGLFSDLWTLHVVSGRVEIALGWSIVFFVIFGSFLHGLQPAFQRGHWWLSAPAALVGTSLYLLLQFGMISLRREGFEMNQVVIWRVAGSGLMAAIFALLLQWSVALGGMLLFSRGRPWHRARAPISEP